MGVIERIIETIRNYALSKGYDVKPPKEHVEEVEIEDDHEVEQDTIRADERFTAAIERAELIGDRRPRRAAIPTGGSKVHSFPKSSVHQNLMILEPQSIDESGEISEYIKEGQIVIVKLEGLKFEAAQRIVDFLSGVVRALDGQIEHVSNKIFVVAPQHVDISSMINDDSREGGILASLKASFR
ncbi:MAG: cell division protein SepF [Clostridiales bacterium]|jgi:cell division inhibitor SepF|nr:cell division protein SepF [Clostridiales bacterium]